MRIFNKNNGMKRVIMYAKHPMKDWYLLGSGIEDDCFWVSQVDLITNWTEEL
jgi:hypothetical protein